MLQTVRCAGGAEAVEVEEDGGGVIELDIEVPPQPCHVRIEDSFLPEARALRDVFDERCADTLKYGARLFSDGLEHEMPGNHTCYML